MKEDLISLLHPVQLLYYLNLFNFVQKLKRLTATGFHTSLIMSSKSGWEFVSEGIERLTQAKSPPNKHSSAYLFHSRIPLRFRPTSALYGSVKLSGDPLDRLLQSNREDISGQKRLSGWQSFSHNPLQKTNSTQAKKNKKPQLH